MEVIHHPLKVGELSTGKNDEFSLGFETTRMIAPDCSEIYQKI
jgi:hypothetical protein